MASGNGIALMSHLMRRAGFGVTRDEVEAFVARGYEETVEQLLDPAAQPDIDEALLYREIIPRAFERPAIIAG